MLGQLSTDVRYALRIARRRKWVSAAIVVSVAFGIGGATAIFAVIDRVLLRPLPVPSPEQVVWIRTTDSKLARVAKGMHPGDAYDVRMRTTSFARMAAYNWGEATVQASTDAAPERVRMVLVEQAMADVLGMRPAIGQLFSADDYAAPSNNVLVTHRYWRRALAGDSSIVGRTILINSIARTVIGVLPPAADLLPQADFEVWRPLLDNPQQRAQSRTALFLIALARLESNVPLARAQAEIDALARTIATEQPRTNSTRGFRLEPLADGVVGQARAMFLLLGGAVVMVLLIACASVGNLLVARSEERARELAVRAALGGSGRRLVRQLLTESLLLCMIGGALGMLLAPGLLRGFALLYPGGVPRAAELGVDFRVMFAATGAIMLVGVIAALPLVRQSVRLELARDLRDGGRTAGSIRQRRFASVLVAGQLALSVALLFGGALLLSTYRRLATADIGFDAAQLLSFDVAPARARYPANQQVDEYYRRLIEGIGALPGVRAVGTSNLIPFASNYISEYFTREGKNDQLPNQPLATFQSVSDDFLTAVGLPLLRGQRLTRTDTDSAPPVVVVNAALADAYYPGEDPIGRRISLRGRTWQIVGVVGNKRHQTVKEAPFPEMFLSRQQLPRDVGSWVLVRATTDVPALVSSIRSLARQIDPAVPVAHVATMRERLSEGVAPERFRATVVACFAVLALVLATVGLYGVVSHTVSRRTREIGIRMALGEDAASLVRRVIKSAGQMSLAGAVLGALGAVGVARALEGFLVGTEVWNPALLGGLVALLAVVTVGAAYVPARRASRVDPVIALRSD